MIKSKKVIVVLPSYNAEQTLGQVMNEIPFDIVDEVVLVDDASNDQTINRARELGIKHILQHTENRGYGANQKSCYHKALSLGADIIILLHPDYQYTPRLIPSMAYLIAEGIYPVVLGSRMLGRGALKGGMPLYKYFFNRVLTFLQNLLTGQRLSEYHTGYRAFARHVLENIHFDVCADDFVFDNQVLSQILYAGYEVGEISCPTHYFSGASSIGLRKSIIYGLGVLKTSLSYCFNKAGIFPSRLYKKN